jgi:hypothetical protein
MTGRTSASQRANVHDERGWLPRAAAVATAAIMAAGAALAAACAGSHPPPASGGAPVVSDSSGASRGAEPPPPAAAASRSTADSTGFLDRDDVTVRMAGDGLIIDIMAMSREVVSLATDDLRTYLQEALKKVPDTVPADLRRDGTFFLVGFTSTEKEVPFEPSQVQLNSEGRQFYPRYIVPVSQGFESKVLRILSAPVWAVYIYDPGIDLVSNLEFTYGNGLSTGSAWRRVVRAVELARSRAKR